MGKKSKDKHNFGLSPQDRELWQKVVDSIEKKQDNFAVKNDETSSAGFSQAEIESHEAQYFNAVKAQEKPLQRSQSKPQKPMVKEINKSPDNEKAIETGDEQLWDAFKTTMDFKKQGININSVKLVTKPATQSNIAYRPANSAKASDYKAAIKHHPLEDKIAKKIAKSKLAIQDRIDLHGMSQDQAYGALLRFISHAHQNNYGIVLVITGKGAEGRGILRQMVPEWLNNAPFIQMTNGFRYAHITHGGTGALYVRLRKNKPSKGAK